MYYFLFTGVVKHVTIAAMRALKGATVETNMPIGELIEPSFTYLLTCRGELDDGAKGRHMIFICMQEKQPLRISQRCVNMKAQPSSSAVNLVKDSGTNCFKAIMIPVTETLLEALYM